MKPVYSPHWLCAAQLFASLVPSASAVEPTAPTGLHLSGNDAQIRVGPNMECTIELKPGPPPRLQSTCPINAPPPAPAPPAPPPKPPAPPPPVPPAPPFIVWDHIQPSAGTNIPGEGTSFMGPTADGWSSGWTKGLGYSDTKMSSFDAYAGIKFTCPTDTSQHQFICLSKHDVGAHSAYTGSSDRCYGSVCTYGVYCQGTGRAAASNNNYNAKPASSTNRDDVLELRVTTAGKVEYHKAGSLVHTFSETVAACLHIGTVDPVTWMPATERANW